MAKKQKKNGKADKADKKATKDKSKGKKTKSPNKKPSADKATGEKKTRRKARKLRNAAWEHARLPSGQNLPGPKKKLKTSVYEKALADFQVELVRMQKWIASAGLRVVVICEGRDAAGKGGTIKRITQSLNPRICKVVALTKPTERERTQWYFQRYAAHLPAAGEMVIFDRSWYNRAGVERVMGFCTEAEYQEFLRSCPEFERMLVRSGIQVIKYWFSVSDSEQERRFKKRVTDPIRRWKISDMDLQSRAHWVDYSKAKDVMLAHTDIKQAPWFVVRSDDKKRARLNTIAHLLTQIPYEKVPEPTLTLPPKQENTGYVRPPITDQTFVPEIY